MRIKGSRKNLWDWMHEISGDFECQKKLKHTETYTHNTRFRIIWIIWIFWLIRWFIVSHLRKGIQNYLFKYKRKMKWMRIRLHKCVCMFTFERVAWPSTQFMTWSLCVVICEKQEENCAKTIVKSRRTYGTTQHKYFRHYAELS